MTIRDLNTGRVNVRAFGSGPPVLFVHGLGTASDIWFHQAESRISQSFRVLLIDLPGFGRSEALPHSDVDAVIDVLEQVCASEAGPVHYVGTSMGGFFGLALALRRPTLLRSLALLNTAARNAIPAKIVEARLQALASLTMDDIADMVADQALGRNASPHLAEWLRDLVARSRPDVYKGYLAGILPGFDVASQLSAIAVPSLVITGDDDRVIPARHGSELARLIPGATYHELAGVGHIACAEASDEINRILLEFLTSVDLIHEARHG